MAPNIKDQLPIINRVLQFFKRDGLVIDSPLFRLHHQVKIIRLWSYRDHKNGVDYLFRNINSHTTIIVNFLYLDVHIRHHDWLHLHLCGELS